MARELEGKVAVVTGAASGIGLASAEAMLAAGSRVVMVDRDEAALTALSTKHGDSVGPLVIDLLDPNDCATLLWRVPGEGRPARHLACKCGYVRRRRLGRCRHWGPAAPRSSGLPAQSASDVAAAADRTRHRPLRLGRPGELKSMAAV